MSNNTYHGYIPPATKDVNKSKGMIISADRIIEEIQGILNDDHIYAKTNQHNEFNRWINFGCEFMGTTEGVITAEINGVYNIRPDIANIYDLKMVGNVIININKLSALPSEQKQDSLYMRHRYCEVILWLRQATNQEIVPKFNRVIWPDGLAPEFSKTPGALDVVVLHTADSGETWVGQFAASNCR